MPILDAVGNELHEGDFVVIEVKKLIRLKIVNITEPGKLIVPGSDERAEYGTITYMWVPTDPIPKGTKRLPSVYKSPDPGLTEKVAGMAEGPQIVPPKGN